MSAIRARDDTWTRPSGSPGHRRHGIFRRKAAPFRASPAATVGTLLLVAALAASGRGFGVASGSAADPSHAVSSFKFMVIGDWGTGDMNQMRTARGMMDVIGDDGTFNMVLSTGDQMYPSGAKHVADEQFDTKFESVFFPPSYKSAPLPFFMTLGNHDCEGSVQAMVNYTDVSPSQSWKLPDRYYSRDFDIGSGGPGAPRQLLRLVVADACNIVCGPPTEDASANFRCEKVTDVGHDRAIQLQWLDSVLKDDFRCSGDACAGDFDEDEDREVVWKVVMSHWPLYSVLGNGPTETMIRLLKPVLERHEVDFYFNGHDHSMQHLRPKGAARGTTNYFVSGAGGYELHPRLKKDADGARPSSGPHGRKYVSTLNDDVDELFSRAAFGFMSVSIEGDHAWVTAYDANDGNPVPVYHTQSHSNRGRRRASGEGDADPYNVFDATSAFADLEL